MRGYFLLLILLGLNKNAIFKSMTVSHTKSGPYHVFGHISYLIRGKEALSVHELKWNIIEKVSTDSMRYIFDH